MAPFTDVTGKRGLLDVALFVYKMTGKGMKLVISK